MGSITPRLLPWVPEAFFFFSKEAKRSEKTIEGRSEKKNLWPRPVHTSLPCDFETRQLAKPVFLTRLYVAQPTVKPLVNMARYQGQNL